MFTHHSHSSIRSLRVALAVLAASLCAAAATQAQTVITSLPYTITTGGSYVLNSNLSSTATSGTLITINASNVTLDFQNHYIAGANNTASGVVGVYAYERSNLTIRNGTIAYCYYGIEIAGNNTATTNSVDEQITNMRVTYSFNTGIDVEYSPSSVVSGCQVSQTGYSTSTSYPIGINVAGAGVTVQNCVVSNVINASGSGTIAIFSDGGSFTRQCQVSNAAYGVESGIYQDDLASDCTTAFTGGTDGGGNASDGGTATNAIQGRTSSKADTLR